MKNASKPHHIHRWLRFGWVDVCDIDGHIIDHLGSVTELMWYVRAKFGATMEEAEKVRRTFEERDYCNLCGGHDCVGECEVNPYFHHDR